MNQQLQEQVQRILDTAVADGSENSLQFCVYQNGECLVNACAGWIDYDRTRPIDTRTVIPIYSTSKGVPAAAMSRLIAQGKVSPDMLVAEVWPEFAKNGKEKTRILHLLNHTSGLHQRFPEQKTYQLVADWPYMIHVIEESAPDWEPGTKTRYQSLTYGWVTAEIIQRVSGKPFWTYVQEELFGPEGIQDFYFGMTDEAEQNAAEIRLKPPLQPSKSISVCDPLDDLMREPCIRRAALPGFNGIASAHALASFYNAILTERYFSRDALKAATTLNCPEPPPPSRSGFGTYGYGFALSGSINAPGNVFGHGGYGGSDGLADQQQQLAIGFTAGTLGDHPCKAKLYELVNLTQREGWAP
jgi:CubicO group peptidase (beta-lactamase class C family)